MRASQVYVFVSLSPVISQARPIHGCERLSTLTGKIGSTYVAFRLVPTGPGPLSRFIVALTAHQTCACEN